MRLADAALNRGDYSTAIREYDAASQNTLVVDERAQALQHLGIAQRKAGDLRQSASSLRQALRLARGDEQLTARVQRDMAMTMMSVLTPNEHNLFFEVMVMLEKSCSALPEGSSDYWATVGFIGRAHLLYGNLAEARNSMMGADDGLRRQQPINHDYELNNLVWLMCAEPLADRLRHWARARSLVKQTGQTRRSPIKLAVIVFGGWPIYRLVRQRLGK
jgi:tetratricopeptide (TPR) repeat protein